jgi:hypothetical protein
MTVVTLYTKPGCSLCDEVRDVIEQVREEFAFDVDVRDILMDLADFNRYKHDIPIVLLDGTEIARHRMSADEFRAALRSAGVCGYNAKRS